MNMRMNGRLSIALLLMMAVLMSFSVRFAQADGGDTSTESAGVGEIAKAADNFNVSGVPTQEQAKTVVNAPPVESATANFDVEATVRAMGQEIFSDKVDAEPPVMERSAKLTPPGQTPSKDVLMQADDTSGDVLTVFTGYNRSPKLTPPDQTPSKDVLMQINDASGDVLTVFTDYSLVAAHAKGEVFFQGHIAGQSAASLMIVGKNTNGTQYALSHGDVMGLTTGGDVFFSIDNHWYVYDYTESGDFVSLTDSEGSKYAVATTDDGGFTITDPAGDIGDFNPDGSYDIKDPAGDVLDQGALFGENDDDPVSALDNGGDTGSLDANSGDTGALDANTGDTSGG